MKTIITYYSESGSTEEVAKILAAQKTVSLIPLQELIKKESLNCELLIVGSPNKYGKLVPDIVKLLKKHHENLSQIPVIIYFTCMDFCIDKNNPVKTAFFTDSWFKNNIKEKLSSWDKTHSVNSYLKNIEKLVPNLNLQSIAFFKGRLDFSKLSFFDTLVMKFICLINRAIKPGNYLKKEDVKSWLETLKLEDLKQTGEK